MWIYVEKFLNNVLTRTLCSPDNIYIITIKNFIHPPNIFQAIPHLIPFQHKRLSFCEFF